MDSLSPPPPKQKITQEVTDDQFKEGLRDRAVLYSGRGVQFMQDAYQSSNEKDLEMWNHVRELPTLDGVYPYACFILNLVIPGSGTVMCAVLGDTKCWSKT